MKNTTRIFALLWMTFNSLFVEAESGITTKTLFSPKQLQADFSYLYETLAVSQYDLFYNISKAEYDQEFQQRVRRLDHPMDKVEAYKHFQQFMALARIAHTRIDFPVEEYKTFLRSAGKTLPVYFSIREGKVYVDEYYGADQMLQPNDLVTMINRQPVMQWLSPLFAYLSADDKQIAWSLAGSQIPALLWLHEGEQESYTLTVKRPGGNETVEVKTLSKAQQQANAEKHPDGNQKEAGLREQRMLDEKIAYLKPGPFYNVGGENIWDTTEFIQFIDDAFQSFLRQNAKAVLIDLRNNPGGTNSFSDPLIAWFADEKFRFASDFKIRVSQPAIEANNARLKLEPEDSVSAAFAREYAELDLGQTFSFDIPYTEPNPQKKKFRGEVFILIDRYSYSNAVSVAAIAKDYGFATLLGEKTADFATTFGAMEHFSLPETGFTVGFPKALIVRPNGDATPGGVSPDIKIDFSDSQTAGDYGLKQAMSIISSRLN